ncbi:putative alpha beta-hydrolase family [Monocercomonoides exilis]|uniref:putative alpha beta-hydrolase family n=1 Tax=Monocercomonoides exilis TaxID=2049356 RepID=UPI00355943F1|nr:putative alpha beta-hydrolase family [Monocercomonoides exilis]|eukprot:MONOS_8239.1-p1 / transcript=MONOS_8239.1 / gene=MONOS_8239 / organism=Monocercomonoides_exilis_PA203 / gene_product=alpha / transcript_product=alpha / location=Mono_scaffold00305:58282-59880(+) / protein_length=438 / sequence_SO=supercontig / SO=protein_coding / is_pseudo=false
MGASTALLYSGRDQSLNGIILDSPFASLKQLVDDMAEQVAIPCACCLLPFGRSLVKSRVKKRTGLDIDNLRPIEAVHRSTVPLVIGHGKDDRLISIAQSTEIFNSYPCLDKQFFILPGDHNASRPQSFFQHALLFVLRVCGGGRGGGNSTGDRDNEAPISMNPAFVSSLPLSSSARSASAAKTAAAAATTTTTASSFTLAANPAEDHFDSSDASNSKLNAPSAKEESGEEEVRALSALPNPSVYSSSSEPSLPPSTSRLLSATPSHASSSSASASASASASVSSSSSSTSSSSGGSFISHTPSALVASTKNIQKSKGHIPLTDDANLYMRVEEGKESAEYVEREKELELKDSKSSSILPPNIAITQQTMNRMTPPTLFESDNQSASRPASYNSALSVSATSVSSSPLQSPSSPALSQSFSSSQISHSQNELSIPQPSS